MDITEHHMTALIFLVILIFRIAAILWSLHELHKNLTEENDDAGKNG